MAEGISSVKEVKHDIASANKLAEETSKQAVGFGEETTKQLDPAGVIDALGLMAAGLRANADKLGKIPYGFIEEQRDKAQGIYDGALEGAVDPRVNEVRVGLTTMEEKNKNTEAATVTLAEAYKEAADGYEQAAARLTKEAAPMVGAIATAATEAAAEVAAGANEATKYGGGL